MDLWSAHLARLLRAVCPWVEGQSFTCGVTTVLTVIVCFGGCASARVPLCAKIAAQSYPNNAQPSVVSRYAAEAAVKKGITVIPLSPFAADIHGGRSRMKWYLDRYPFMLCGFDPTRVIEDEQVYNVCMSNARRWMTIVNSDRPQDLMSVGVPYADACAR